MRKLRSETRTTRLIARLSVALIFLAALFILIPARQHKPKFAMAQGSIKDVRIVPDHAEETKWGSKLVFKAEYLLSYSVANNQYSLWVDSGVRGESEAMVRAGLPRSHASCMAMYDVTKPQQAIGVCQ